MKTLVKDPDETTETKQQKKDAWDKADVILKVFVSLAVGVLLFFGKLMLADFQSHLENVRQENMRRQTLVEMVAARQSTRFSLKAQVFGHMLGSFIHSEDLRHRIRVLELLGLNFANAVHLKPLFEALDSELFESDEPDGNSDALREELRSVARRLVRFQIDEIRAASGNIVTSITLRRGEYVPVPGFPASLELRLLEKDENKRWISVSANSKDLWEKSISFRVAYYDMPFVDYTTVEDAVGMLRYSVVLQDYGTSTDTATVAVVVLPDVFMLDNTFFFEDQLMEYVGYYREPPVVQVPARSGF